ncbi:MAG: diguanylate cyclase [Ruminococcus sp.]|nr:diguanylate cyclase [Ruminococcus sp.]
MKGCCRIICEIFRKSPVYRIGGDEFVIVLMHHDYEHRISLLEELIQQFTEIYQQTEKDPWERYSMSVGMAEYTLQDTSAEEVLKRADSAMYTYKTEFKKKHGSYR